MAAAGGQHLPSGIVNLQLSSWVDTCNLEEERGSTHWDVRMGQVLEKTWLWLVSFKGKRVIISTCPFRLRCHWLSMGTWYAFVFWLYKYVYCFLWHTHPNVTTPQWDTPSYNLFCLSVSGSCDLLQNQYNMAKVMGCHSLVALCKTLS